MAITSISTVTTTRTPKVCRILALWTICNDLDHCFAHFLGVR